MDKYKIDKIAKKIAASENVHDVNVSCFYDTIISQDDFNETFEVIHRDHRMDASVLIIKYDGTVPEPSDVLEVNDYDAYGESFDEEYGTDYHYIVNNWWPKDIVPIISKVCSLQDISVSCLDLAEDEPFTDWDEFEKWIKEQDEYSNSDYDWLWELLPEIAKTTVYEVAKKEVPIIDFKYILDEINFWNNQDFSDIGLLLKPGWKYYKSHGYSQGDACVVICKDGDSETALDHIIWDAPIYCRVVIDGNEIYVDSKMEDVYSYDKKEVINIVKNHLGTDYDDDINAQLMEKVPENPQYI